MLHGLVQIFSFLTNGHEFAENNMSLRVHVYTCTYHADIGLVCDLMLDDGLILAFPATAKLRRLQRAGSGHVQRNASEPWPCCKRFDSIRLCFKIRRFVFGSIINAF